MSYEQARKRLDEATELVKQIIPGTYETKFEKASMLMDLAEMEMHLAISIGERPRLPRFPDIEPEDAILPYYK